MLRGCALLCALQYGWRQPEPTDAKPIFYFSFFFSLSILLLFTYTRWWVEWRPIATAAAV